MLLFEIYVVHWDITHPLEFLSFIETSVIHWNFSYSSKHYPSIEVSLVHWNITHRFKILIWCLAFNRGRTIYKSTSDIFNRWTTRQWICDSSVNGWFIDKWVISQSMRNSPMNECFTQRSTPQWIIKISVNDRNLSECRTVKYKCVKISERVVVMFWMKEWMITLWRVTPVVDVWKFTYVW